MNDLGAALGLTHPQHLNYPAILVSGIANFVLGGMWYSPALFAKPWMKAAKLDARKMDMTGVGAMYAGAALGGLMVALCLAYILRIAGAGTVMEALRIGWTCWLGFVAAATLGDYLFLRRGAVLFLINNGLHLLTFSVSSIILVLWK